MEAMLGTSNPNIVNTEPEAVGLQDPLTEGPVDDIVD